MIIKYVISKACVCEKEHEESSLIEFYEGFDYEGHFWTNKLENAQLFDEEKDAIRALESMQVDFLPTSPLSVVAVSWSKE